MRAATVGLEVNSAISGKLDNKLSASYAISKRQDIHLSVRLRVCPTHTECHLKLCVCPLFLKEDKTAINHRVCMFV